MISKLHIFINTTLTQKLKFSKRAGFTLIELLVVIVIIGLLATISAATFGKYFGKARDAVRTASVSQLAQIIKVDGADKWANEKYIYDLAGLQDLVDDNDYRIPKSDNNICYLIGLGRGIQEAGDDNQFAIVAYGEETSTETPSAPGIIVDGTALAIDAIQAYADTAPSQEDLRNQFDCSGTFQNLKSALVGNAPDYVLGASGDYFFFIINAAGDFVVSSD